MRGVDLSHNRLTSLMIAAFHQHPQKPFSVKEIAEIIITDRVTVTDGEAANLRKRLYRCMGRLVATGIVAKTQELTVYKTTVNKYTLITAHQ